MTHLTTTQILQTVDGTADDAIRTAVTSHLVVCPECRKEMNFQRSLLRVARKSTLPQVSQRLAANIMSRIDPASRRPFSAWVLDNMGSLFALMMVLGIVWLVISQPMTLSGSPADSQGNRIVAQWRQDLASSYAKFGESLKAFMTPALAERTNAANGKGGERVVLVLVSLAALLALDRLWLGRLKLRARN